MTVANLAPDITVILTTFLAAFLAYIFQNRSWHHQHQLQVAEQEHQLRAQFSEQERERAVLIFDEISRLMDKRLYRLHLLYWRLKSGHDGTGWPDETAERFEEYRQVLYEWNDSINRNLALVQRYFGHAMRDQLDYRVGASFASLGRTMERWWKSANATPPPDQGDVATRLNRLTSLIYSFNLDMISAIQTGMIAPQIPEQLTASRQEADTSVKAIEEP
jgi:hypothetical protein